jgi:hypothetical protein
MTTRLPRPALAFVCAHSKNRFERRLRRRHPVLGEASEGAVEAPSD